MGQFAGRFVAVLTLLFAAGYLVQIDDSLASSAPAPQPKTSVTFTPILVAQAETASREYFIKRNQIVPLGASSIRLPILMYHYVRTPPSTRTDLLGYRLSVAPEVFQTQMDWLYHNDYHAVNFNDVRDYFAGTRPLPPRPFVITLDDGYTDLYTAAYPILRAHRFTAVAYIVTSFVGQSRYVSREQVLEMDHAGIQIASHTVNHADLAKSSFGNTMYQLLESKRWLEQLLGHPVVDFAYPSGQFNSQVMTAVRQAGYDTAVTEQVSIVHSPNDRYAWARVRVGGGEGMPEFVASLGDSMPTVTSANIEVMSGRVFRERPTRPYL